VTAKRLAHVNPAGDARMVDVSAKPITRREARARATVRMSAQALAAIVAGDLPKGEVLATARIAGIQAAKRCSDLIPMCHPLSLTFVDITCVVDETVPGVRLESTVRCEARTGAEMEALAGAAVAALTVVDCLYIAVAQRNVRSARKAVKSTREALSAHRVGID